MNQIALAAFIARNVHIRDLSDGGVARVQAASRVRSLSGAE